ncbi:threonine synthase [Candidatus Acidulodesulfobacterium sp. H_13]|uniref:threonine synthase n=1 Tax=Candidatus Acidulodesulfobacterium sp. H_13 TaxID=3395470 RepID=UPI003AF589B4
MILTKYGGVIRRYREFLPEIDDKHIVTLLEGNTPLIKSININKIINRDIEIYFKYEGLNPTGSFKDRGMTMAVSKAVSSGSKAVICASTGNTSASASAYAARAGIKSFVLIPEGKISSGKLSQALAHGATVMQIRGNFDDALVITREIAKDYEVTLVNSVNPYRLEGQKTASFEIIDELGAPPTHHILPVGNAGNITAYWEGYKEYFDAKKIDRLPKMLGFQAEGSAPIVLNHIVKEPHTVATAIRIGNPASWQKAVSARDESDGLIDSVSDEDILKAYSMLASMEGVFCEPASAITLAGLIKLNKRGFFKKGDVCVLTLTGHGLKDPGNAIKVSKEPVVVPCDKHSVLTVMGLA